MDKQGTSKTATIDSSFTRNTLTMVTIANSVSQTTKKDLDNPEARKQREADFAATEKRRGEVLSVKHKTPPPNAQFIKQQTFNNREYPTHFYSKGGRVAEK